MKNEKQELIEDLALALLYLTSWQEESRKEPGGTIYRSWLGYPFEILNELERNRLIRQFSNSIHLTEKGKEKATELIKEMVHTGGKDEIN